MTATNIINKRETAKHLKRKRVEIQLQERGEGEQPHFLLHLCSHDQATGDREEIVLFFLQILSRKEKLLRGLKS